MINIYYWYYSLRKNVIFVLRGLEANNVANQGPLNRVLIYFHILQYLYKDTDENKRENKDLAFRHIMNHDNKKEDTKNEKEIILEKNNDNNKENFFYCPKNKSKIFPFVFVFHCI